jgi:hypothetical protein
LTEKGHPTIMRLYPRDDRQGEFIAPWIADKYKGKKIAILHDKSAYGKGLAQVVKDKLTVAGVTEILFEGINPGEKDHSAVITKLKNAGAEFVYFGGYHTEAGLMLRQAADQGYKLNLMTGDSIATSEFWQISGPAGEGTLFTFPTDPRRSPSAAKALEQFKAQGFDPEGFTLFSYGVVQAIAEGIKRAPGQTIRRRSPRRSKTASRSRPSWDRFGSTAKATPWTRATTSTCGAPANTHRLRNEPRPNASVHAADRESALSRLLDERFDERVERGGRFPLRRVPGVEDHLHRTAPQRRHRDRAEIAPVDQLLFAAVQHGERDSKIAHHCALVSGPAGADAGPEIAARPPVRTQNIVEEKRRNIGETGSEERGDIGGRLDAVDAFLENEFHRRIGQERLAHRLTGCERRRSEDQQAARLRKIRRHFQSHMAAQTPADEPRLMKAESVDDRPNRAGVARKRVGARILRVVRLAMAGKIDCDQPEAFAEAGHQAAGKRRATTTNCRE